MAVKRGDCFRAEHIASHKRVAIILFFWRAFPSQALRCFVRMAKPTAAAVSQPALLLFSCMLACCAGQQQQQQQQQPAVTVLQALDLLDVTAIPYPNASKPTAAGPVGAAAVTGAITASRPAVSPVHKPAAGNLPAHNGTWTAALAAIRARRAPPRQVSRHLGTEAGKRVPSDGTVQVTLLHFNDWHVRVEATKGSWCGLCTPYDVSKGRCSGGLARMSTYVKQQRALDPDLLLLNAGDDFIGTEWDRKASVDAAAAFMNVLGPDAMTVGNHEWDKGLDKLQQYLDALDNKAVLGANIDFQGHKLKDKIKPYVVKQVKGKKVCILGLTTMYGLPGSSQMGPVKIQEPYSKGRQLVDSLKGEGCHATVLLSHLGYTSDLVAASAVPGLDLIIGGHSHSFLWPNPNAPPAFFKPENGEDADCCGRQQDSTWGPYPTFAHNVPVVQASWGSRYMGKLVLQFEPADKGGRVAGIKSEIVLLGGPKSEEHMPEDQEALDEIKKWRTF